MNRRTLNIALHWTCFMLLLAMIKGGASHPAVRWVFVGAGGTWVGLAIIRGVMAKPGPKLQGLLRTAFTPLHWGMYGLVAAAVVLNALALLGVVAQDLAWTSLLVLLVASIFLAILHLWRHTTLNDGALRMIFPKAWHKHL